MTALLALLALSARPALAQAPPPARPPGAGLQEMVVAGAVHGAGGLLVGGATGWFLETQLAGCSGDVWLCGVGGMVLGAAIGEVTMLPLGVHTANARRGSYGWSLAASALIPVLGVFAAGALLEPIGVDPVAVAVAVPIAQLAAAVAIERHTGRVR